MLPDLRGGQNRARRAGAEAAAAYVATMPSELKGLFRRLARGCGGLERRDESAAPADNPAGEFEFQEDDLDCFR